MKQLSIATARVLGGVVIVAALASLAAPIHWLSDLLANLRVQLVIGAAFVLLLTLAARQYRLALLVAICMTVTLVLMTAELWPSSPTRDGVSGKTRSIRLMTINVLSSNHNHDAVVDQIRRSDPDVCAVLELTTQLQRKLDTELKQRYPHATGRGVDIGDFGIALYSKLPLTEVDVFQLNEQIDSIGVTCAGMRVYATHPLPPMGAAGFQSRNAHLNLLAQHIAEYRSRKEGKPIVAMGDFNLTPWSPIFQEFKEATGLRRAKVGFGLKPTWYARGSWFPFGLVLDHVMIDASLVCVDQDISGDFGSDHRAVLVEVVRK